MNTALGAIRLVTRWKHFFYRIANQILKSWTLNANNLWCLFFVHATHNAIIATGVFQPERKSNWNMTQRLFRHSALFYFAFAWWLHALWSVAFKSHEHNTIEVFMRINFRQIPSGYVAWLGHFIDIYSTAFVFIRRLTRQRWLVFAISWFNWMEGIGDTKTKPPTVFIRIMNPYKTNLH